MKGCGMAKRHRRWARYLIAAINLQPLEFLFTWGVIHMAGEI